MSKPQVSNKIISIEGNKIKQLSVAFSNSRRKILILDNRFNLDHDIHRSTFTNLCFETCKTLKQSNTFVYIEAGRLSSSQLLTMISKHKPDGIMFASISVFNKTGLDPLKYFCYVRKWNKIPTILTTDFHKWTATEGFEKGESGKSLIGFNLKHLVAVTQGKNLFTDITEDELQVAPKIIRKIDHFDKFIDTLHNQKVVSIDTEGASLSRILNTLFTIQFGIETSNGIKTYVLPWQQKNHTWSDKELNYIKKKLRNWILTTKAELVFHFGQFDIGQLCVAMDIPFFPCKVWDTISGEFATDENHKSFDKIIDLEKDRYKPYSLDRVENRYGIFRPNDILEKEDRANMARFSLEEIAQYGAWDVHTILLIRQKQIEASTHKLIGYKSETQYKKLVIHQLGMMISVFSMLMDTGIYIDIDNAKSLIKPGNIFEETSNKIRKMILETKAGTKANNILLKKAGISPSGGLFSSQKAEVLSLTKPSHLRTLFFDVMKLEPVKTGKNGEPSTDKAFQNTYKHIENVKYFSQNNKVKTLKANFADAIIKLYKENKDFQHDHRLRPMFGFTKVLPGRLSVNKPNSQNIPTRSDGDFEIHKDLVKFIKANFSVVFGRVMLGSDFSAHEVRMAGVLSKDPGIRKAFLKANEAIRKYRLAPLKMVKEAAKILAIEGDIHIQNVLLFFNQKVDKNHVLRYRIKAIVFGVLYGKLAKALAKELGIEVDEAQNLIDIMFDKWNVLYDYIEYTHKMGKETFMVHYPNYRIRHLWAYLHDDIWVERAMDRRAINSPIQGFASDIGVASIYTSKKWVFENITSNGYILDSKHVNIVHDASYQDTLFEHLPFAIYLLEHGMSTLPMNYYKEMFDFDISIPLSSGIEFGANWSKLNDWDFRPETLIEMMKKEGERLEKTPKEMKKVLHDTEYMLDLRTEELKDNPYRMKVDHNSINKLFKDLHMFREQV